MSRWEPDARGRLAQAAMELYTERGFEETTVVEIAERAGLTERTFFRYFADKREVIFQGQEEFKNLFVSAVAEAPDTAAPFAAVAAALHVAALRFEPGRPWSQKRHRVINANPALQERELVKLATLVSSIAEALRARGVDEPAASLAAQSGVTVFHIAFQRWVAAENSRTFTEIMTESLATLKAVTAGE